MGSQRPTNLETPLSQHFPSLSCIRVAQLRIQFEASKVTVRALSAAARLFSLTSDLLRFFPHFATAVVAS